MSYEHTPSTSIPEALWDMPPDIPPGAYEGAIKEASLFRKDEMIATKLLLKADGHKGHVEFFLVMANKDVNKGIAKANRAFTAAIVKGHVDEASRPIAPDGQTLEEALAKAVGAPVKFEFVKKGEYTNLKSIERI